MTPANYPWRIFVAAAISMAGNIFLAYYLLFGLRADGVGLDDKTGQVVVTEVDDGTPAASAGLKAGDIITGVNNQPIRNTADWFAHRMNFSADRPTVLRIQRGSETLDVPLVIHGRLWDSYTQAARASLIIFLAYKFITLAIGLFVVFRRPREFEARLGGWVLVAMATVFEAFQWGLASAIRGLPFLLAVPVMIVYVSAAFRTPLLAAFFSLYPKRLFENRFLWVAFWAGPAIATLYGLELLGRTVYDPQHLSGLTAPWVLLLFGGQSLAYLLVVLIVLPLNYFRLDTPTDRRRFRVLVFGALISMVFYLPRVIGTTFFNLSPGFYDFFDRPLVSLVCDAGMLILPFSFAYAILKNRLFDLRVIIRRGVQYALAKGVLVAIPLVALGLWESICWFMDASRCFRYWNGMRGLMWRSRRWPRWRPRSDRIGFRRWIEDSFATSMMRNRCFAKFSRKSAAQTPWNWLRRAWWRASLRHCTRRVAACWCATRATPFTMWWLPRRPAPCSRICR